MHPQSAQDQRDRVETHDHPHGTSAVEPRAPRKVSQEAGRRPIEALERRTLLAAVTGLTLYNADTDRPIGELTDGYVIDLERIGTRKLSVVAETDRSTRSVRFGLDNRSNFKTESGAPFAIAGNKGNNMHAWSPTNGRHVLKVTPYSGKNAGGSKGRTVEIDFEVKGSPAASGSSSSSSSNDEPEVTELLLYNADNNRRIGTLRAGMTIDFDDIGTRKLSIVAEGNDATESVRFALNGDSNYKTESASPFAIAGDSRGGDNLLPWTPRKGEHTLKVTPFSQGNARGDAGDAVTVNFEVEGSGGSSNPSSGPSGTPAPTPEPSRGDTIYVSTNGSDRNSGSSSRPMKTITAAARKAGPGDTVLIKSGTYREAIKLRTSGREGKPITLKADGNVIVDSNGKSYALVEEWKNAARYIDVIGITFKNADNRPGGSHSAVKMNDGWRLFNVTVERVAGNGIGMFGEDIAVVDSVSRYNGCSGIAGSSIRDGLLKDSKSYGNNTRKYSGRFEGGGGKFTRVDGFVVDGYESYDNYGPGIWFDGGNINVTVKNSEFHHNKTLWEGNGRQRIGGTGILFEISGISSSGKEGKLVAEGNYCHDNDLWGIVVYASRNATVKNNRLVNNSMELKDNRSNPWMIEDLTITGNTFKDSHIVADRPTASNYRNEDFEIDRNRYDNDGGTLIKWVDRRYNSISAIRSALGFEHNGSD